MSPKVVAAIDEALVYTIGLHHRRVWVLPAGVYWYSLHEPNHVASQLLDWSAMLEEHGAELTTEALIAMGAIVVTLSSPKEA